MALASRLLGAGRARGSSSRSTPARPAWPMPRASSPDARLVDRVERQLAGAVGSASARVMVASVAQEEPLGIDDVIEILDEASQLRGYARALEEKSRSLEAATAELRAANEQLQEPRPPEGRLHVLGDPRAAHAADLDPGALRADARHARHGGRPARGVPAHRRLRERAAEPAGQPGARHGQDRIRPRRVAQRRRRHARRWSRTPCAPPPSCSASAARRSSSACPTGCRRSAPTPTG